MQDPVYVRKEEVHLLSSDFLSVVQNAAKAAYPWIGKGDKNKADGAATRVMREMMNNIPMDAVIVIGEGEMDKAPMLYIGEKLGRGSEPKVDIAVDPIEGTTLVSKGQDNSLAVLAVAERDSLLHAPDMYMEKIAVGPKAKGCINLDKSLTDNMFAVAKSLGKQVSDLTVMIQERPRHDYLIQQVFDVGAKVRLFSDVDITGAIATSIDDMDVDILVGIGGAPEGVIAAVALKCLGGDFQGRLMPKNQDEKERCKAMGILDVQTVLKIDDIVKSNNCLFVATGITDGLLVKGVQQEGSFVTTHSFIATMRDSQFIQTRH